MAHGFTGALHLWRRSAAGQWEAAQCVGGHFGAVVDCCWVSGPGQPPPTPPRKIPRPLPFMTGPNSGAAQSRTISFVPVHSIETRLPKRMGEWECISDVILRCFDGRPISDPMHSGPLFRRSHLSMSYLLQRYVPFLYLLIRMCSVLYVNPSTSGPYLHRCHRVFLFRRDSLSWDPGMHVPLNQTPKTSSPNNLI